jgi:histidinol-phosphate aminotransferase
MDITEFSPSYVREIAPYQPGKPIGELAREFNLDEAGIIKLASNENPLGMSPLARDALQKEIAELGRYPDGNQFDLKAALARRYAVSPECLVVGNGSNDLLEMVGSSFLGPGRAAVISKHAFAIYTLVAQARGAKSIYVPAKNFAHDLEAMARAVTRETRVVFVANPNNPTGTFAGEAEVAKFLADVPPEVIVVLDEAYNEYLPREQRYDSMKWLAKHPNLIILRTFSKIYGLAGLRVGFGMMAAGIADLLNRVRQPFNVNSLALAAAGAALLDNAFVHKSYELNRNGMAELEAGFRKLGLSWIPSVANFISFEVPRKDGKPRGGAVYVELLKRSVIVRPLAGYEMPDHLRVTIGTPEENSRFLAALADSLNEALKA